MIPKEILRKVRHIEIRTRGLVNDLFGGEYHSVFKGRGMKGPGMKTYYSFFLMDVLLLKDDKSTKRIFFKPFELASIDYPARTANG